MKKNIFIILASIICFISCTSKEDINIPEDVTVNLSFSLDKYSYNSGLMTRSALIDSSEYVWKTVFKENIENGNLLGDSIDLKFTPIENNGLAFEVVGNKNNSIHAKTGKYLVTGKIGINTLQKVLGFKNSGSYSYNYYYSSEGLLNISDTLIITKDTKNIILHGSFNEESLIISKTKFSWNNDNDGKIENTQNGILFNGYYYMFVKNTYIGKSFYPYIYIDNNKYYCAFEFNKYYYFGNGFDISFETNISNGWN